MNRAPSERAGELAELLAYWEGVPLNKWSDDDELRYLSAMAELERDCFLAQDDSDPGLVDVSVVVSLSKAFHLRVEPDEPVWEIKKKVGYVTGIEPFDQDIYLGRVRMMDHEQLPPAEAGHIVLNVCRLPGVLCLTCWHRSPVAPEKSNLQLCNKCGDPLD